VQKVLSLLLRGKSPTRFREVRCKFATMRVTPKQLLRARFFKYRSTELHPKQWDTMSSLL